MVTKGAFTVILNADNTKVLLQQRRDFRLWELPGGKVELNENYEDAAIREAFEETGYEIEIEKCIGIYEKPQFNDVQHVFRGYVTGGICIESGPETLAVKWFDINNLPSYMLAELKMQIRDSFSDLQLPLQKTIILSEWEYHFRRILMSIYYSLKNLLVK